MRKIIEKFIDLEKKLADEKGDFVLFALFQREESPHWLDVVISAPWIRKNKDKALMFMTEKIQSILTPEEMVKLSMVVILSPTEPFVREVTSDFQVEHGNVEFTYREFNGMLMKHAYIITSNQDAMKKKKRSAVAHVT